MSNKTKILKQSNLVLLVLMICLQLCIGCKNKVEPQIQERANMQIDYDIKINGLNLRYTMEFPKSYSSQEPTPLILALHYGGQVTQYYGSDFINILVNPALKSLNAIIVAPNNPGPSGWTNPDSEHAVIAMLDSIKKDFIIDTTRIIVTGFSMGAIGTWFFAAEYADIFCAAIPVSGMPDSSTIENLKDVPMYVIHSRDDEIFPFVEVEKIVSELKSKGKNIQLNIVSGVFHYNTGAFVDPLAETIPWIKNIWGI